MIVSSVYFFFFDFFEFGFLIPPINSFADIIGFFLHRENSPMEQFSTPALKGVILLHLSLAVVKLSKV